MTTGTPASPPAKPPHRRADDILTTLADRLGGRFTATTVFGTPVEREGVTVIPVAIVRFGFGGGGGEDPSGGQSGEGGGGAGAVHRRGTSRSRTGARATCPPCTRHGWWPCSARRPSRSCSACASGRRGAPWNVAAHGGSGEADLAVLGNPLKVRPEGGHRRLRPSRPSSASAVLADKFANAIIRATASIASISAGVSSPTSAAATSG